MKKVNGIKILIAEDSPTQAEVLKHMLEKNHYDVTVAKDGTEALALVHKHKPEIVISDIIMPEMNGYKLCKAIKSDENTFDIPVILLTALSRSEDVLDGLECGADNFVTKPYAEDYLISIVEQILANKKLRKSESVSFHVELHIGNKKRFISATQQQMLTLLLSTYEAAAQRNIELVQTQEELERMNVHMEEIIEERTAALLTDIQIRKVTEKKLLESEKALKEAQKIGKIGNWELDLSTQEIKWSDQVFELYERDIQLGPPTVDEEVKYYTEEQAKMLRSQALQCIETGLVFNYDIEPVLPSGKKVYFTASIKPVKNENGKLIKLFGTVQDITERKQAEEALWQSKDKYRRIVETANEGIWVLDEKLQTNFVNHQMARMLGYNTEEMMGQELVSFIFDEDMPDHLRRMENRQRGVAEHYERKWRRKNGQAIWTIVSAAPIIDAEHHSIGSFAMCIDITERKQAEEAYRESEKRQSQIIEFLPDATFAIGLNGTVIAWNRAMEELSGVKAGDILGKGNYEYSLPFYGTRRHLLIDLLFKSYEDIGEKYFFVSKKGECIYAETEVYLKGEKRYLWGVARSLYDSKGDVTGAIESVRDITELKQTEETLREREHQLSIIYDTVGDEIFHVAIEPDGNYRFVSVNHSFLSLTGMSEQMIVGQLVNDIIPEPFLSMVLEKYKQAIEKSSIVRWEENSNYPSGRLIGEVSIAPVVDSAGRCTHLVGSVHDITERKRAEEILREKNLFLQALLNTIPAPVFYKDSEGHYIDCNKSFEVFFGKTSQELAGKSVFDLNPYELAEIYHEKDMELIEHPGVQIYESQVLDSQRNNHDVVFHKASILDSNNHVSGLIGVILDITERKLMEKQLFESEKHYHMLFDSIDEGFCIIEMIFDENEKPVDYRFLETNPSFEKQTGLIDVRGKRIRELAPDNEEYWYEIYGKIALTGQPAHFENHAKELERWFDVYAFRFDQPENRQVAVLFKDITERKLSEQKLILTNKELAFQIEEKEKREEEKKELEELSNSLKLASQYSLSLIEASPDPLITINPEGKIMDLNEATVNITGLEREKLIGSYFFDFFTEPQSARESYQEVFDKGFVVDYPLTLRHINGKLTDVLFNGSVYKDDEGDVKGVVVVARDITEKKRIETELIEAIKFAEQAAVSAEEAKIKAESATQISIDAVKAKQQFLSNMSHEIRTPMNAIIGFTKVLLKTDFSAKQKEYLEAIKVSGDALIVLINDILDLAKVDAGKMTFEHKPFKMATSISAMLHLFKTKIQEKNLKLVTEYDKKIPVVLLGDPVRLHQIILNLVSNAVKFTHKGKITVSVCLLNEDEETVTVEFAITDTGIGIPEEKLATIFGNFQQATSGTSRLYGGTGLGLSIAKQLIEAQGGSISVKSKIDEGSTFSFILPFLKTTDEVDLVPEVIKLNTEVKNIKVLVAEDVPLNQLLMKTLLDDFGFVCDIAANGKIAIEKMQANVYDIILMDLQMPEMNGFEATKYIREKMHSDIPIVALTADVTTVDLAKCKAVGMTDYIVKPVDERILYSKIVEFTIKPSVDEKEKQEVVQNAKCINLEYLKQLTKSNPQIMVEMISLYMNQTPELINSMKESYGAKDWTSLHGAVHKLIPSFSIVGISSDFENIAKAIQECAFNQQDTTDLPGMILRIENVCIQAYKELEIELNDLKTQNHERQE